MIRHRHIDLICILAAMLALALTGLFFFGEYLGLQPASSTPGYLYRLFDSGRVHRIDLQIDDWAGFLAAAPDE